MKCVYGYLIHWKELSYNLFVEIWWIYIYFVSIFMSWVRGVIFRKHEIWFTNYNKIHHKKAFILVFVRWLFRGCFPSRTRMQKTPFSYRASTTFRRDLPTSPNFYISSQNVILACIGQEICWKKVKLRGKGVKLLKIYH